MSRSWVWIAAVALLPIGFGNTALAAESKTEIYVANTNPEFVVGDPENPSNSYTVEVLLQGGQSGTIVVDFIDYVSGPQGRATLPGGSSPSSLENAIYLASEQIDYIPNGTSQVFELKFLPRASIQPRLYSGGLRIGFQVASEDSGFSNATVGVTKNLVVTPYGGAASLDAEKLQPIRISQSRISPLGRSSFIDSLLPDIPNVINFGPAEVLTVIENPGEYPMFASIKWEFLSGQETLARQELPARIMAGGIEFERRVQTLFVDPVTNRSFNVLPNLGFVTLRTTITSQLTGVTVDTQVSSQTFLVLMWKEPVFALITLLILFRLLRRKKRMHQNEASDIKGESLEKAAQS